MHFIRFALEQLRFRSDPAWLAMVEANLTKPIEHVDGVLHFRHDAPPVPEPRLAEEARG